MYFDESSKLISDNLQDKDLIRSLDRELARSFAPGRTGFVEQSLLSHRTGASFVDVEKVMSLYEAVGVASAFNKVSCPNGHRYPPDEAECPECGRDLSEATPTNEKAYAILRQPQMPAFDRIQRARIFLSYRTGDSAKLAADIYYSLLAEGYQAFLDSGEIPPGSNAEKQYLTAQLREDIYNRKYGQGKTMGLSDFFDNNYLSWLKENGSASAHRDAQSRGKELKAFFRNTNQVDFNQRLRAVQVDAWESGNPAQ